MELLRVKAEVTLLDANPSLESAAQATLTEALSRARDRGFLAWELRCAISLAALWQRNGKPDAARERLAPVCQRFSESLDTRNLRTARALLGSLVTT